MIARETIPLENIGLSGNLWNLLLVVDNFTYQVKRVVKKWSEVVNIRSCQRWFTKFLCVGFNLKENHRSGRLTIVDKNILRFLLDSNVRITTRAIVKQLNIYLSTTKKRTNIFYLSWNRVFGFRTTWLIVIYHFLWISVHPKLIKNKIFHKSVKRKKIIANLLFFYWETGSLLLISDAPSVVG